MQKNPPPWIKKPTECKIAGGAQVPRLPALNQHVRELVFCSPVCVWQLLTGFLFSQIPGGFHNLKVVLFCLLDHAPEVFFQLYFWRTHFSPYSYPHFHLHFCLSYLRCSDGPSCHLCKQIKIPLVYNLWWSIPLWIHLQKISHFRNEVHYFLSIHLIVWIVKPSRPPYVILRYWNSAISLKPLRELFSFLCVQIQVWVEKPDLSINLNAWLWKWITSASFRSSFRCQGKSCILCFHSFPDESSHCCWRVSFHWNFRPITWKPKWNYPGFFTHKHVKELFFSICL